MAHTKIADGFNWMVSIRNEGHEFYYEEWHGTEVGIRERMVEMVKALDQHLTGAEIEAIAARDGGKPTEVVINVRMGNDKAIWQRIPKREDGQ
jgi:hypothetical protein